MNLSVSLREKSGISSPNHRRTVNSSMVTRKTTKFVNWSREKLRNLSISHGIKIMKFTNQFARKKLWNCLVSQSGRKNPKFANLSWKKNREIHQSVVRKKIMNLVNRAQKKLRNLPIGYGEKNNKSQNPAIVNKSHQSVTQFHAIILITNILLSKIFINNLSSMNQI